jgi:hypothetical protein
MLLTAAGQVTLFAANVLQRYAVVSPQHFTICPFDISSVKLNLSNRLSKTSLNVEFFTFNGSRLIAGKRRLDILVELESYACVAKRLIWEMSAKSLSGKCQVTIVVES